MSIIHYERIADGESGIELFAARCDGQERSTLVRTILGADYAVDVHGRPIMNGRTISISHTAEIVVVAMRPRGRVGADVEMLRSDDDLVDFPEGLSPKERKALLALPPSQKAPRFYRLWTAKEALSKALGLGVSIDLAQIEVRMDAAKLVFESLYGKPELAQGWEIVHRELPGELPALIALAWDKRLRSNNP